MTNINAKQFSSFLFPLPPLDVQQRIVDELDRYQRIIDGANQVIANWRPTFDIDPSWPMVRLGDVAEVVAGQSPEGQYYNDVGQGIPFYQGKTEFGDRFVGPPAHWTTVVTKEADPGDILMSVRAPVGPVNITRIKCCIGRGLAAIRAKADNEATNAYLFYVLHSMEKTIHGNGGAAFDSINKKDIESIRIPLPPLDVQQRIVDEITQQEQSVDACKALVSTYQARIAAAVGNLFGIDKLQI